MPADTVSQAAELIRAGQLAEARRILLQVLKENPRQEAAWLWLVQTLPNDSQRIAALEQCLRFNPQSEKARLGLEKLRSRQSEEPAEAEPQQPPAPPAEALPPVPHYTMVEKTEPEPAEEPPALVNYAPEDLPPLNRPAPAPEAAPSKGFSLSGLFKKQPEKKIEETEESDLGLDMPAVEPEQPVPVAPVFLPEESEEALAVDAVIPTPAPSAPEEDDSLQNLRQNVKGRRGGPAFRTFLRWFLFIFYAGVLIVAGYFAWQTYGGLIMERLGQQIGQPQTGDQSGPVFTPTAPGTPVPEGTPTITPQSSEAPPTDTPVPVIGARPKASAGMLAFSSNRGGGLYALYTAPPDGGEAARVVPANAGNVLDPAWSPDGSQLAYVVQEAGTQNSDIYIANADGSNEKKLTQDGHGNRQPSWSADGKQIVYSSQRDGNPEIYTINADGSADTRLTNWAGKDTSPAWSPDGSMIAFLSDRNGGMEIYLMAPDGNGVTRLTYDQKEAHTPAWSPDGKWLAFSSNRDGDREIYVISSSGSQLSRVTFVPGNDDAPVWSPDGYFLAFITDRDSEGKYVLYMMHADGSGAYRFEQSEGTDQTPAWSRLVK